MTGREGLIFIGPPTSGKTTHAQRFAEQWADIDKPLKGSDIIPDLVPVYEKARELIPDALFLGRLAEILERESRQRLVFDNIPRTTDQAAYLAAWAERKSVALTTIILGLSQKEVLYRFKTRTFCPVDRESYHPILKPSQVDGFCDRHPEIRLIPRPGDLQENIGAYRRYHHELCAFMPV